MGYPGAKEQEATLLAILRDWNRPEVHLAYRNLSGDVQHDLLFHVKAYNRERQKLLWYAWREGLTHDRLQDLKPLEEY